MVDTAEISIAEAAADELIVRNITIHYLLLNAGLTRNKFTTNSEGYDQVWAAPLFGHHVLAVKLLNAGLLSRDARIVISGSEAARLDLPRGLRGSIPDYYKVSKEMFDGDLTEAIIANAKGELNNQKEKFNFMNSYSAAKAVAVYWAAALSRRVPNGMGVYAVSPGSVPSTNLARSTPWPLRKIVIPFMTKIGPLFGGAQDIKIGASHYVDVVFEDLKETNGSFYASRPKKMVGPMEIQKNEHLIDFNLQEAGWNALVKITGCNLERIKPIISSYK